MNKYIKLYLVSAALYVAGISLSYVFVSHSACAQKQNDSTSHQQ